MNWELRMTLQHRHVWKGTPARPIHRGDIYELQRQRNNLHILSNEVRNLTRGIQENVDGWLLTGVVNIDVPHPPSEPPPLLTRPLRHERTRGDINSRIPLEQVV
mgnify:CR=1 FL=1